jgi:hypothetical protein
VRFEGFARFGWFGGFEGFAWFERFGGFEGFARFRMARPVRTVVNCRSQDAI